MDTNRLPKQALQCKAKGQSNIGWPRKRWRYQLHLEDQGTGNTPKPSWTWWWSFLCDSLFALFIAGSALQFWMVMFSHSPYWQNCKLCLPSSCTHNVRPSPQQGCWQWQDHQAFNLVTSRTALSFWREIIIIFTATYHIVMDCMMWKEK